MQLNCILPEISDGPCEQDSQCLYRDAICSSKLCTCLVSSFVNITAKACQHSKYITLYGSDMHFDTFVVL
ncbi:hypothetical protein DPMN_165632 [Dreissena polymorpha]|uniref:EB domain-containing protein n=1 Tax=Dreissena polymorpha TaxID=45954 RepID=A0A9D4EX67_DREPO|nr:hypothetical protein DPMN_165632 [Dreissena polymorpha]